MTSYPVDIYGVGSFAEGYHGRSLLYLVGVAGLSVLLWRALQKCVMAIALAHQVLRTNVVGKSGLTTTSAHFHQPVKGVMVPLKKPFFTASLPLMAASFANLRYFAGLPGKSELSKSYHRR